MLQTAGFTPFQQLWECRSYSRPKPSLSPLILLHIEARGFSPPLLWNLDIFITVGKADLKCRFVCVLLFEGCSSYQGAFMWEKPRCFWVTGAGCEAGGCSSISGGEWLAEAAGALDLRIISTGRWPMPVFHGTDRSERSAVWIPNWMKLDCSMSSPLGSVEEKFSNSFRRKSLLVSWCAGLRGSKKIQDSSHPHASAQDVFLMENDTDFFVSCREPSCLWFDNFPNPKSVLRQPCHPANLLLRVKLCSL